MSIIPHGLRESTKGEQPCYHGPPEDLPGMLGLLRELGHRELCWRGEYRTRTVHGTPMGYYQLGRGERTVVFIHGLGDSALTWRPLAAAIGRHARVVVPELPGFGRSPLPAGRDHLSPQEYQHLLQAFLAPLEGDAPVLVGNSMGGWYSARLVLDRPERFGGLMMINPGGALVENSIETGQAFFRFLASADGKTILTKLFHRPPLYTPLIAKGLAMQMRAPVVQQFGLTIGVDDLLAPEQIRALPAQAILVWGERDEFLPDGTAEAFLGHFPGKIIRLPHCSHMGHAEDPKTVARLILELLDGRRQAAS